MSQEIVVERVLCESCGKRSATVVIPFQDGMAFEVCGSCQP